MSPKGESIRTILGALTTVETIVHGLGRTSDGTATFHANVIAARDVLKSADAELKRLARKPHTTCRYQGCWMPATAIHANVEQHGGNAATVEVWFCGAHSATSALSLVRIL